jgi:hypothetical protein
MDHIGIDVHKRDSQICILAEDGEVIERRCRTERTRLGELLGGRPRARIVIEASKESEWVAQCLESLGHEVVVADPNFAAMYATRSRKVKTDRRDARTLAEACRLGAPLCASGQNASPCAADRRSPSWQPDRVFGRQPAWQRAGAVMPGPAGFWFPLSDLALGDRACELHQWDA